MELEDEQEDEPSYDDPGQQAWDGPPSLDRTQSDAAERGGSSNGIRGLNRSRSKSLSQRSTLSSQQTFFIPSARCPVPYSSLSLSCPRSQLPGRASS